MIHPKHGRRGPFPGISDAIEAALEGTSLSSEMERSNSFFLKKGESVYVMRPGETLDSIQWDNLKKIAQRIYVLKKFSGDEFYFIPHNIAEVLNLRSGFPLAEFGSQNRTIFIDGDSPRTKIIERCVKVEVDRLGNVSLWKGA